MMMHPDDIGHARAEARQQAAEDGVMLVDEEDDWYDLAEQDAIRAEVNADLDALHAEAARYRAAGVDPQLAMWMARHRQG